MVIKMPFGHAYPAALPMFPLGTVLLPGMLLPLHVFEDRYRKLLRDRAGRTPPFGVVLIERGVEVGDKPESFRVGTAVSVAQLRPYPDGRADLVVRGERRFQILTSDWNAGYLTASVAWLDEPAGNSAQAFDAMGRVEEEFRSFLAAMRQATGTPMPMSRLPRDPAALSYAVAAQLPLGNGDRQRLLELETAAERLSALARILHRERRLLVETGAGAGMPQPVPHRFSPN